MSYFDLHCHTFFKLAWLEGDRQKLMEENTTTDIDKKFKPGIGAILLRAFGKGQLKFFDSQSSLKQITQGQGAIVVVNMIAMENSYANLDFCAFKNVFQRIKNIKRQQLAQLGKGQISYASLLDIELSLATEFENKTLNGVHYRIINSFNEIKEDGITNVILAIEGGHCFYQRASVLDQENITNVGEVMESLRDWKRKAKAEDRPRLFYITLTHHTTNCLTNHAFSVPPAFAGDGKNKLAGGFNPTGNSLTAAGREFIKVALEDSAEGSRILIDVKHMSVRSRLDFYRLRREMIAAGHPPFPILATHMGVTGLSLNDAIVVPDTGCQKFHADNDCFEVEYLDTECTNGFFVTTPVDPRIDILKFNPWSMNLYDEEISEIVESGGLIGFCFDSRVLGNEGLHSERFSKQELNPLPSITNLDFNQEIILDTGAVVFPFRNKKEFRKSRYPEKPLRDLPFTSSDELKKHTDLLALCQNMVHTVLVGGPDTWDCICFGSDYDGIINSIDFAPTASAIPGMKDQFKQNIRLMVVALNKFMDEQGKSNEKINLPSDFYERISIENAKRFLRAHF